MGVISGPRIEITPPNWNDWKKCDKQGNIFADRIRVIERESKGKNIIENLVLNIEK